MIPDSMRDREKAMERPANEPATATTHAPPASAAVQARERIVHESALMFRVLIVMVGVVGFGALQTNMDAITAVEPYLATLLFVPAFLVWIGLRLPRRAVMLIQVVLGWVISAPLLVAVILALYGIVYARQEGREPGTNAVIEAAIFSGVVLASQLTPLRYFTTSWVWRFIKRLAALLMLGAFFVPIGRHTLLTYVYFRAGWYGRFAVIGVSLALLFYVFCIAVLLFEPRPRLKPMGEKESNNASAGRLALHETAWRGHLIWLGGLVMLSWTVLLLPWRGVWELRSMEDYGAWATPLAAVGMTAGIYLALFMGRKLRPRMPVKPQSRRKLRPVLVTGVIGTLSLLFVYSVVPPEAAYPLGYHSVISMSYWRPIPSFMQVAADGLLLTSLVLAGFLALQAWGTFLAQYCWSWRYERNLSVDYRATDRETLESRLLLAQAEFEAGSIDETTLRDEARRLLGKEMATNGNPAQGVGVSDGER